MARARSLVLACLLLSCLAADVLAKRIDSRFEIAAADSGLKAKTKAIYDCPDTPRMSGCAETGCALHMHGKTSTLICAQCKNEKAYVLVNQNTRKAQCGERLRFCSMHLCYLVPCWMGYASASG